MAFFEDECDYDMFRDLTEKLPATQEHPLDIALRTNNPSLRCYFWEHGDADEWDRLSPADQLTYNRPPAVPEPKVPSGSYYMYGAGDSLVVVAEKLAREHWMHSFRAQ